jgi:protein SCO1/2
MRNNILLLFASLLAVVVGCKPSATTPAGTEARQTYAARGVIQQIPPDHSHLTVQHEKIPGYMGAMTMDFSVRDTNALAGLAPGDEIAFTLVVTADDDWIENLARTGKNGAIAAPAGRPATEPELAVGDLLPDYAFTSESGQTVRFSDYRGRALAFTFFFTSCPLPEYCPRMNKHFARARELLLAETSGPTNWQMLSLSFDPAIDTPQVLARYASLYRGTNAERWLFAVGSTNTMASLAPKLDLNFWRENGTLSHNLRTVVVDGTGKIIRQFDGNDWTPQQLAEALREGAKGPQDYRTTGLQDH